MAHRSSSSTPSHDSVIGHGAPPADPRRSAATSSKNQPESARTGPPRKGETNRPSSSQMPSVRSTPGRRRPPPGPIRRERYTESAFRASTPPPCSNRASVVTPASSAVGKAAMIEQADVQLERAEAEPVPFLEQDVPPPAPAPTGQPHGRLIADAAAAQHRRQDTPPSATARRGRPVFPAVADDRRRPHELMNTICVVFQHQFVGRHAGAATGLRRRLQRRQQLHRAQGAGHDRRPQSEAHQRPSAASVRRQGAAPRRPATPPIPGPHPASTPPRTGPSKTSIADGYKAQSRRTPPPPPSPARYCPGGSPPPAAAGTAAATPCR